MKRNLLLSLGVLVSTMSVAQTVHIDVAQKECKFVDDSLVVQMSLTGSIEDLNSRDAIVLTPFLSVGNQSVEMTPIQLNGKYKQILYGRNKEMRSRMKNSDTASDKYVQGVNSKGTFSVIYSEAVAKTDWMDEVVLQIRCEKLDIDNEIQELSKIFVQRIDLPTYAPAVEEPVYAATVREQAPVKVAPAKVEPTYAPTPTPAAVYQEEHFKGTYVAPESDATDERNQRDLNFSLEEAQVMVNINPQILSLKELFTVAMSYKENQDKFYHIISTCVKLYPTHPIANLNAASMAIELGDKEAANKYLQIVPYESLAYKNCRGAYELMNGNIYEGIRLLKSAKAEGSEEAGYNLDLFFKQNK